MTEVSKEDGIIVAVLERFEKIRLPRALDIKEKVDGGATLDDSDINFLEEVLHDAESIKRFVDQRPDLQNLYARGLSLYHEITERALENEKDSPSN